MQFSFHDIKSEANFRGYALFSYLFKISMLYDNIVYIVTQRIAKQGFLVIGFYY